MTCLIWASCNFLIFLPLVSIILHISESAAILVLDGIEVIFFSGYDRSVFDLCWKQCDNRGLF